jgi:cytochrome P450
MEDGSGYRKTPGKRLDGMRACIGRTFAEQEMIMVVALILQKFQVELADPSYNLRMLSSVIPNDYQN